MNTDIDMYTNMDDIDIENLREQIDCIDNDMVSLFEKRMKIAGKISTWKKKNQKPVADGEREREVIERVLGLAEPEFKKYLESFYSSLFSLSRLYQTAQLNNSNNSANESKETQMQYALVGAQLAHSYSKFLHEMFGGYSYDLRSLNDGQFQKFMSEKNFKGINVTIPYKKSAMKFCNILSPLAQRVGSVNTIIKSNDGNLLGYNTDYFGFLYMSKRAGISFEGKKILIFGSGGTSLTATAAVADSGAKEIVVVSRNGEVNYDNVYLHCDSDIVINTTPVGMYPENDERLIDLSRFTDCKGVIDVIYNPLRTLLLIDAKRLNIPYTNGLPMLVAQAKRANNLFLKSETSEDKIEYVLKRISMDMSNIALIGMPGCGKSTVGKSVAKMMGREFFDTDEIVEEKAGMNIEDIFKKFGVKKFREMEMQAVQEIGKKHGVVIATGGGTILNEKNCEALMQNSFIVLLERNLEMLDMSGRPLSKNLDLLRKMEEERHPIYHNICNYKVKEINLQRIVQEVVKKFNENFCC